MIRFYKGTATDLVVQIVLIAESMRLQAMMATYGIQTQTPHEVIWMLCHPLNLVYQFSSTRQVEPVQIWSSTQLIKIFQELGVNDKVGLTGRPPRPVGSLGTSKVYRVCGMTVLCYPLIFEVSDFYLYRDMALLIGRAFKPKSFSSPTETYFSFKMTSRPNCNLSVNIGDCLEGLLCVC